MKKRPTHNEDVFLVFQIRKLEKEIERLTAMLVEKRMELEIKRQT